MPDGLTEANVVAANIPQRRLRPKSCSSRECMEEQDLGLKVRRIRMTYVCAK